MKLKGKNLIKVSSIFLIIGAVLSSVLSIIGIIGGGLTIKMSSQQQVATPEEATGLGIVAILSFSVLLILAIIQLVAGICGIKNCNKSDMAGKCLKYGIMLIVIVAVYMVIQLAEGRFTPSSLLSFLFPVLYTWGAKRNLEE